MFTNDEERTGSFTFAAEGNINPLSPYFIGKLSHPSPQSGVTIGAGYDMLKRSATEVSGALTTAGADKAVADKMALGAGLTSTAADTFVKTNRDTVLIKEVQVLRNLFSQTYPGYVSRAKACFDYHKATFKTAMPGYDAKYKGAVFFDWDSLYPAIRVIAIDFVYQGFGSAQPGYGRPLHMCMANDFDWLIAYISQTPGLHKYEAGRGRAKYLLSKKEFETRSYSNCVPV